MDKLAESTRDQNLATGMGGILVNSNDFKNLNCLSFSFKREAFVMAMHKRFGADYDYEVIKRVADKAGYFQITTDYDVWCEFLDPSARVTKENFNLMTLVERMAYISGCYRDERVDEVGDVTF